MYKISVLANPTIPTQTGRLYSDTGKPVSQFRVELAVSGDIDEMLDRIAQARKEQDFCYLEFKDMTGLEHSVPIVQGYKIQKEFDDNSGYMDVLVLDFIQ